MNRLSQLRERQCRELWKLRAALHDDCCVADDWANYHQRLNRRYDSGYKSIENQLSSSLEGNILAASSSLQVAAAAPSAPPADQPPSSPQPPPPPPPSGSSTRDEQSDFIPSSDRSPSGLVDGDADVAATGTSPLCDDIVNNELAGSQKNTTCRKDATIDSKLADLDLDDVPLDSLLSKAADRDCQSRSSRSSNEEEKKAD